MIEDAEERRPAQARRDDRRADQRQHRHRPGDGLRGQGLQAGPDDAGRHEPRAPHAAGALRRRAGPDAGDRGHDRRGLRGRGARRRSAATSCRSSSTTRPTRRSTAARPRARSWPRSDRAAALDAFVAGVGTGGTITGVGEVHQGASGRRSRSSRSSRARAAVLCGRPLQPAPHPGHRRRLRARHPRTATSIDEVIPVEDEDAFEMAQPPRPRGGAAGRHLLGRERLGGLPGGRGARPGRQRRHDPVRHRRALPEPGPELPLMPSVSVYIPTPMRRLTGGQAHVDVEVEARPDQPGRARRPDRGAPPRAEVGDLGRRRLQALRQRLHERRGGPRARGRRDPPARGRPGRLRADARRRRARAADDQPGPRATR